MEPLSEDERRAADFFADHGLTSARPSPASGKSPDLVVEATDGYCFYAEVKSVDTYPDDRGITWNEFNQRLASHVRKGSKQFSSVNSARFAPNVLVIVSHEMRMCRPEDIFTSLNGLLLVPDGPVVDAQPGFRNRRVMDYLTEVDAIILLPDHSEPSIIRVGEHYHYHGRLLRLLQPS